MVVRLTFAVYFIIQDRVTYSATGDADTIDLFSISPESGVICVRQILLNKAKTQYTVTILVDNEKKH